MPADEPEAAPLVSEPATAPPPVAATAPRLEPATAPPPVAATAPRLEPATAPHRLEPASAPPAGDRPWSWPALIGFRFGFLLGAQYVFPFPLGLIPKTDTLAEWLGKPWEWALSGGAALLGTSVPANATTGSGDTAYAWAFTLLLVVLAALGTIVWTAVDRRRRAHPRLARVLVIGLRYSLAFILLGYGVSKLSQFPAPGPMRFDENVGEMSPMGMLWTFMGSSQPYSMFAGSVEILGGLLLLFRRTSVLGGLVAIVAMADVFVLNLSYDVPVKLFSFELLLMAAAIVLPHARRLFTVVLGHAVAAVPAPPRPSPRRRRIELALWLGLLGCGAYQVYNEVKTGLTGREPERSTLYGSWIVDHQLEDGVELPAGAARWQVVSVDAYIGSLRFADTSRRYLRVTVDDDAGTASLRVMTPEQTPAETVRFRLAPDATRAFGLTLTLDGTWAGKPIHVELHRAPAPLLTTRGFHWIAEYPFNR